jgi:hypothetical protein
VAIAPGSTFVVRLVFADHDPKHLANREATPVTARVAAINELPEVAGVESAHFLQDRMQVSATNLDCYGDGGYRWERLSEANLCGEKGLALVEYIGGLVAVLHCSPLAASVTRSVTQNV